MPSVDGFGDFHVRQTVHIEAGKIGQRVQLSAVVVAATIERLQLALRALPEQPDALTAGSIVRIGRHERSSLPARIVSVQAGPIPIVALRSADPAEPLINQRAYRRVRMPCVETHVMLFADGRARRVAARIADLSIGGAGLIFTRPVTQGSLLSLRLPLTGEDEHLDLDGQIAWVQPLLRSFQAGMRFSDVSNDARTRLLRMIDAMDSGS